MTPLEELNYQLEQTEIALEMTLLDQRRVESDIEYFKQRAYALEQILNANTED